MITANGRTFIKNYLAGQAGSVAGSIAVGIGAAAATLNDSKLQFEFARCPVDTIAYDFTTDSIIYKGSLDETIGGKIYEVALYSDDVNATDLSSIMITSFDSDDEDWDTGTWDSSVSRIGNDSLKHTPAASATSASVLGGLLVNFEDYSSSDVFTLAFNVDNANCASIAVRFRTDSANYYEYVISNPSVSYQFVTFAKGAFTVTGTPDWGDINEIEIRTTAKAAGSASVEFEGLRLEDVDGPSPTYGLLARFVPSVPVLKTEGFVQDIEYALAVNI